MRIRLLVLLAAAILATALPASVSASRSAVTFRYLGRTGDLVRGGDNYVGAPETWWSAPDGAKDAVFLLTLPASSVDDLAALSLVCGGGWWNTLADDGAWAIGVTDGRRSTTLLNAATSTIRIDLSTGATLYLHVKDAGYWTSRTMITLTITYSNAQTNDVYTYAH